MKKWPFVKTLDVPPLESQAHCSRALTTWGCRFCKRPIGDLQQGLYPAQFMRVQHGSIVNLQAMHEPGREDSKTRQTAPLARGEVRRLRDALGLG